MFVLRGRNEGIRFTTPRGTANRMGEGLGGAPG